MSIRQLDRVVNQLEKSGELVVKRSSGRFPNHYSFPLMNPDKMTGLKNPEPRHNSDAVNPVISDTNPVIAVSHDPSVRSVSKNDHDSRARGYKQKVMQPEPRFLYPPPDFQITEVLYLWLAEMCFAFSEDELKEATQTWLESRNSQPYTRTRTLAMWQADWQKFIRVYWNIRRQRNGNGHGKPEEIYTGPVKSKPDPKLENCPDCRGMGNVLFEVGGVKYAKVCKHERSGVAAA